MTEFINTTKKGVIYVRVSDLGQVNGTSLENQERACREYASRNGFEIVQIFIEKGESATAANRTEFLKALEFCRSNKGQIHAFIVWKIDRFARNATDHFAVRANLTKYGTNLFSVTEPITQDAMGKLMETFLAGYAEFENEVRKQRCTGGMRGRLRNGIWCWWPPLGYVHSKKIKDRRKTMPDVPDEERFLHIQRGLRLYLAGNHSLDQLTKESNRWGLRTRTGKPMRKQLWEVILKDKFYAGVIKDPWDGQEYPGAHQPMITIAEYEKIQRVKKQKSNNATKSRLRYNPDFPLRGTAVCECNHPYTASWNQGRNRRYANYYCRNRECPYFNRSLSKEILENDFHDFLQTITPSPNALATLKLAVSDYLEKRNVSTKRIKRQNQTQLRRLENRRKELLEMRINKEIPPEEYKDMKEDLDRQIAILADSKDGTDNSAISESEMSSAFDFLENLAERWKNMLPEGKQRLQKAVLREPLIYCRSNRTCRTAELPLIFGLNASILTHPSGLVAGVGRRWNQIANEIRGFYDLAAELAIRPTLHVSCAQPQDAPVFGQRSGSVGNQTEPPFTSLEYSRSPNICLKGIQKKTAELAEVARIERTEVFTSSPGMI